MLLFFATLIFIAGTCILRQAKLNDAGSNPFFPVVVLIVSFWILHGFLVLGKSKGDELFLPLAAFLISVGWLEIYHLRPLLANKQVIWIIIAELVFILWLCLVRDYRILEDYKYLYLVGAILLQISVSLFGQEINGAKLWFRFGFFSIQPVEFIKIFLTFFLAAYLKQNREILEKPLSSGITIFKYHALLFVLWSAAEIVLIIQKDLGIALLLFGVFLGLFYVTTRRGFLTALGITFFFAGAFTLYKIFPHVQVRINNWLNPWSDPGGAGYQVIQALYALGEGGIFGTGLGCGKPGYIPAVHTDFIYVAIAEELGLLGALIVLGIFLVLIQRMFRTSLYSSDEFSSYLSLGLSLLFTTQVFIIVAGSVKLIPLTGITLPFVSYGGSSLVSNFILLALFMQISGKIKDGRMLKGE